MEKELVKMAEIKLIGLCVRTSYEQEIDKMKGSIFP
ncbi:hypothetical protein BN1013_00627 [Candidatus Rubidus massiliensis]|nr:hypothetical protein BN1013_00627 [Candidatus Rubidus massiliensis]